MNLIQQIEQRLTLEGYSKNTVQTCKACLNAFFKYHNKENLSNIKRKDVLNYLETLKRKGYSKNTQNQHINAIKYYQKKFLERDREFYFIERSIKEKKIPIVLSLSKIQSLIANTYNIKTSHNFSSFLIWWLKSF